MAEWSKAHDWKSCVPPKGTVGSNPTLSAINKRAPLWCFFVNDEDSQIRTRGISGFDDKQKAGRERLSALADERREASNAFALSRTIPLYLPLRKILLLRRSFVANNWIFDYKYKISLNILHFLFDFFIKMYLILEKCMKILYFISFNSGEKL